MSNDVHLRISQALDCVICAAEDKSDKKKKW